MTQLSNPINIDASPESDDYALVPAGKYPAMITEVELKDTNAGNGQYLNIRFDIIGAEQSGRVVFTNINIRNPNPKAEEIGAQELGQLCKAIGITGQLTDTEQLTNGTCEIKVTIKDDPQYGPSNQVKGFYSTLAAGCKASAPKQAAAVDNRPAWMKAKDEQLKDSDIPF